VLGTRDRGRRVALGRHRVFAGLERLVARGDHRLRAGCGRVNGGVGSLRGALPATRERQRRRRRQRHPRGEPGAAREAPPWNIRPAAVTDPTGPGFCVDQAFFGFLTAGFFLPAARVARALTLRSDSLRGAARFTAFLAAGLSPAGLADLLGFVISTPSERSSEAACSEGCAPLEIQF